MMSRDESNPPFVGGEKPKREARGHDALGQGEKRDDELHELGIAALRAGDFKAAIKHLSLAANLQPNNADYHNNLGVAYKSVGNVDEAIASYRRALELNPAAFALHFNLAEAKQSQGNLEEAAVNYRKALELSPNYAKAHNNLGNVLMGLGQHEAALASFQRAIAIQPGSALFHVNFGNVLRALDRSEEALVAWRRAQELDPTCAEAYNSVASVLQDRGCFDQALAHYQRAFELKPNYAEARCNWSLLSLLRGDFERGWPGYEWRLLTGTPRRNFLQPRWDGSPLGGRTILLHAEQGFGDCIQFCRYATLVAQSGGSVIVECQEQLGRLFRDSLSGITIVNKNGPMPSFDVQCPLLSLPLIFRTALNTIPSQTPYLFADSAASAHWRTRLAGDEKFFKVGLAWAGNKTHRNDRKRSLTLANLGCLGRIPGVRFYSLQKGDRADQARTPPTGMQLVDWSNDLLDFADTAALVVNLDLVISVDTAVAHLAGALGKPVWVLLPSIPDWRWLQGRDDSPWYPMMRLFRQGAPGDWDAVIDRVATELPDSISKMGENRYVE